MTSAIPVGDGRHTVPGNRWDLVPPPTRDPRVSVVLPYYDQQPQLERLLAGIALQRGPVEVLEVLVGDDGSPEPPRVPAWYDGPPVRVVRQPDLGVRPAAARNLAAEAAAGDVLVFLDGDMVPGPDYVAAVAALPAVAPEALVVGTRHHVDLTGWTPAQVTAWLTGHGDPPQPLEDPAWLADGYRSSRDLLDLDRRSYQWVIGAVLTVAAPVFRELGGFDGSIDVFGGEDWDLANRVVNAGGLVAHVDGVAFHDGPEWRVRVGPDGTKNPERRALVACVPSLDDGLVTAEPLVEVVLDAATWDADATLATVAGLLRATPTGVRVVVDGLDPHAARVLRHDPRVALGPAPATTPRTALHCRVGAPAVLSPEALRRLLDATDPTTAGRVRVADAEGDLVVAEAARVRSRVRRWAQRGLDADRLFGPEAVVAPGAVGVERLRAPLDLADVFPR